jgi:hypothetical protein
MAVGDEGSVTLGPRTYLVRVSSEDVRRTLFTVYCTENPSRSWRHGEVRIGAENVFACLTCRPHPLNPCIHIEVARRYLAAQPLEPVEPSA